MMKRWSDSLQKSLIFLCLLGVASSAFALSLGKAQLESALNTPLRLSISLEDVTPTELEKLSADLVARSNTIGISSLVQPNSSITPIEITSPQSYLQYINITLENTGYFPRLILHSTTPVSDSYLEFTLRIGEVKHAYFVLLDHAGENLTIADTASVGNATSPVPSRPLEVADTTEQIVYQAPQNTAEFAPSTAYDAPSITTNMSTNTIATIAVAQDQTLLGIANTLYHQQYQAEQGITLNQLTWALYQTNPTAFEEGNLNKLIPNSILRIPSLDDIRLVDDLTAQRMLGEYQQRQLAKDNKGYSDSAPTLKSGGGHPSSASVLERPPAPVSPVVKLTATEVSSSSIPSTPSSGAQREAEEIAHSKTVAELQARIQSLSTQLANLNRLLALKNHHTVQTKFKAKEYPLAYLLIAVLSLIILGIKATQWAKRAWIKRHQAKKSFDYSSINLNLE